MVTFFALSGFAMSTTYLPRDLNKYACCKARLAGILPIYLVVLAVVEALVVVVLLVVVIIAASVAVKYCGLSISLLFTNTFLNQAYITPPSLIINPPSWSLSVEIFLFFAFFCVLYSIKNTVESPCPASAIFYPLVNDTTSFVAEGETGVVI